MNITRIPTFADMKSRGSICEQMNFVFQKVEGPLHSRYGCYIIMLADWRFYAVICGAVLSEITVAGCAIHPLPENVTGVSTDKIVRKIRCEARTQANSDERSQANQDPRAFRHGNFGGD